MSFSLMPLMFSMAAGIPDSWQLAFNLIGGAALLMYGVDKLGNGLEKASGNVMKKILSVLTGRVMSAMAVGTILTAIVQSSTAITVLTVGFVNAGLMKLTSAVGIIYGANIGTTITAQMFAASYSFKLTTFALPVLGVGFLINYMAKKALWKDIGSAVLGFGMMFEGLSILNGSKTLIQNSEVLANFFSSYATIPVIGILLGMTVTALIHSSSATVAFVMVLGQAGLLGNDPKTALISAVAIMLGDNIGTCITAQLASLTGNVNARRTAWAHTLYNIIGVLIAWAFLPWFADMIIFVTNLYVGPGSDNLLTVQIANSHTIFNVVSAMIFIPITKYYVKFLETIIRDKKKGTEVPVYLDRLLLDTPVAAFNATLKEITRGIEMTRHMLATVQTSLLTKNDSLLAEVEADEQMINRLQKDTISYTVDLSRQTLNENMSALVPAMINSVNDIERIGDHIISLAALTKSYIDNNLDFSSEALDELANINKFIEGMFEATTTSLKSEYAFGAFKAIELEGKIDEICRQAQANHIKRLETGNCSIESGVVFHDIISYMERIADHIYKIAQIRASSAQNMN